MRSFCADLCLAAAEPRYGTAPPAARAWLLVEHPGPWPARDLPPSVPAGVHRLIEAAAGYGIRVQLIRRPAARRPPTRSCFLAWTPSPSWLALCAVSDVRPADLEAVAHGVRPHIGAPLAQPLLLVCTHGARDACCAIKGRPLAAALATCHPELVWETTHVGGDRFAGNVVALPSGSFHGGVGPNDAASVAEACLRGDVTLPYFRGRSGTSAAAQAADYHARCATGALRVEDVRVIGEHAHPSGQTDVELEVAGRGLQVTVRPAADREVLTSCTAWTTGHPRRFDLVSISGLGAGQPATDRASRSQ